jgi:uracil-DNA glycosylase
MTSESKINLKDYFPKIQQDWFDLLKPLIKSDIVPILEVLEIDDKTLPDKSEIFRFTRYPLMDVKFIILGMDPYPNPGDADGLAFSTCAKKCPASLNRILSVLVKEGKIKNIEDNFSLKHWALQGCLLLNTALSVNKGDPGSHIKLWKPFMTKLLDLLAEQIKTPVHVCLWGKNAQEYKDIFSKHNHNILEWVHPVAMTSPSFNDCPHFGILATAYSDFIWDMAKTETHFFTDGACKGNQFTNGRGSWGVACTQGIWKDMVWSGPLKTERIISEGVEIDARPTNIRAEGYALANALEKAIWLSKNGIQVKIYSDSMFWIRDMFTDYIPKWIEKKIPFTKKKNSDLAERLWTLYQASKILGGVELVFVNAWHDRARPVDPDDLYIWLGNKAAEETAEESLPEDDGSEQILSGNGTKKVNKFWFKKK